MIHHEPGAFIVHDPFTVSGITIKGNSWMLEYSKGVIPSYIPFAMGDSLFSTQDLLTVAKSVVVYGRLVLGQLLIGKI